MTRSDSRHQKIPSEIQGEDRDSPDDTLRDNAVHYVRTIERAYPDVGYGLRFGDWVYNEEPRPYNSFGNGAAMRVSAVAWFAKSLDEVKRMSKTITTITHDHPEDIKGTEATAVAIYMAKEGATKEAIRNIINQVLSKKTPVRLNRCFLIETHSGCSSRR